MSTTGLTPSIVKKKIANFFLFNKIKIQIKLFFFYKVFNLFFVLIIIFLNLFYFRSPLLIKSLFNFFT